MAALTDARAPHRRKQRIPPGPAARAAAATLRGDQHHTTAAAPVIDLAAYERAAHGRNTLHMTSTTGSVTSNDTQPSTTAAASRYQQLRGHLAALKLHTAAEALPTVLDQASAEELSRDRRPRAAARRSRSTPPKPAASPAGSGSPACPPRPPWTTSTTTPNPASTGS